MSCSELNDSVDSGLELKIKLPGETSLNIAYAASNQPTQINIVVLELLVFDK